MEMEKKSKGEFLSEDIIDIQILARLPLKSLLRFKSVCKRWKIRISNTLPTPLNLIFCDYKNWSFLHANGNPINKPDCMGFCYDIIASCNGLLVFCHSISRKICIYNPQTREMDFIPDPPSEGKALIYAAGLAFDPSEHSPCYKLVFPLVKEYRGKTEMHFQVFSSEMGNWEVSRAKIIGSFYLPFRPFSIGGLLYWKPYRSYQIMEFDPDGNRVSLIPFMYSGFSNEFDPYGNIQILIPFEDGAGTEDRIAIGEWEGRLAFTIIRDTEIEIWIMNEHRQFSKMYSIGLDTILGHRGVHIRNPWPLPCESGNVVLFWMKRTVFSYDPETGELREFKMHNMIKHCFTPYKDVPYEDRCPDFIICKKSQVPIPKKDKPNKHYYMSPTPTGHRRFPQTACTNTSQIEFDLDAMPKKPAAQEPTPHETINF
ncbi:F-box protein At5g49610-like isoform X2 [Tasmannia lanceolata]|uniref:F-box protein At5g49610-like isoform X2 n=1 Tax=Tasmannia lanceolata TaxID=3420 RepID=UPI00406304A0